MRTIKDGKDMQLPLVKHIDVPNLNWKHLQKDLNLSELGSRPFIFHLSNSFRLEDIYSFLNEFYEYLENLNVHPRCPYPIYIQSPIPLKDTRFLIIGKDYSQDTTLNKLIITKDRERSILHKIEILLNKLRIFDIYKAFQDIAQYSSQMKQLKNLSHQQDFYNRIIQSWRKNDT